jgi:hypothetical protein
MKNVQTILTEEEYEAFVREAKRKGLSIKKASNLVLRSWTEQEGRVFIEGVGREVLLHPVFERWQRFFCEEYVPPRKEILFISSCFWGKPFHESWIFRKIRGIVGARSIHYMALSSAGLIPYEYWDSYPFNSYNSNPWMFSPLDREAFVEINGRRVSNYFSKNCAFYGQVLGYFPQHDAALKAVMEGYSLSGCSLPLHMVEGIEVEEGARNEDYYACLANEESLEKLKMKLEEIR